MTETTWTNNTIRKRLGEDGFIEIRDRQINWKDGTRVSYWQRGKIVLQLIESFTEGPSLYDVNGIEVDPEKLGVRNENTQTGNHP